MGNRNKVAACGFARVLKPGPQITGERAVIESKRRKGLSPLSIDVRHHNTVQVGAPRYEGVFPTNQRREHPWLVVFIRRVGNQLPGINLYRRLPRDQTAGSVFFPAIHRGDGILRWFGQDRSKQLSTRVTIYRIPQ